MKHTPWFPYDVKPCRKGVYETRRILKWSRTFQFWDGSVWHAYADEIRAAHSNRRRESIYQTIQWRGVAKKN